MTALPLLPHRPMKGESFLSLLDFDLSVTGWATMPAIAPAWGVYIYTMRRKMLLESVLPTPHNIFPPLFIEEGQLEMINDCTSPSPSSPPESKFLFVVTRLCLISNRGPRQWPPLLRNEVSISTQWGGRPLQALLQGCPLLQGKLQCHWFYFTLAIKWYRYFKHVPQPGRFERCR